MPLRLGRPFFRQFTTSGPVWAKKKSMATKFKLSFIISGAKDSEIHTETYLSSESFSQGFQGFRFTNPKTNTTYAATNLFDDLDPDVVYIAKHPFLSTRLDSHSQNQIFDKAFEEKACKTFEDYFQDRHVSRRVSQNQKHDAAWRILTNKDGSDFAEWGGIWESSDGNIFFLEAKYFMDFVSSFKSSLEKSFYLRIYFEG